MIKEKTFKIKISHSRRSDRSVEGTLEYLRNYFSYTLEVGNSWNRKINMSPKTLKSFVSNLNKSFEEIESSCFERTHIEIDK